MADRDFVAEDRPRSGLEAGLRQKLALNGRDLPVKLVLPSDEEEEIGAPARLRERDPALAQLLTERLRQGARLLEVLSGLEARAQAFGEQFEVVRAELRSARESFPDTSLAEPEAAPRVGAISDVAKTSAARELLDSPPKVHDRVLRLGVAAALAGLLGLMIWAAAVDYPLRVTSDTPTFTALVSDMGQHPLGEQSPFLAHGRVGTQHATPYVQAIAFLWRFLDGGARQPVEVERLLALVGLAVFSLTLFAVFLYTRRLAGTKAAWLSIPILLGLFGPPHVIWASDLTLHGALYASFFPQNLAIALALSTLLALERRSRASLVLACLLVAATMLVHPFTGVLLSVLATAESCRLAYRRDPGWRRTPVALSVGFALGLTWPAYSLDAAFAETGLRGFLFVGLCAAAPFAARRLSQFETPAFLVRALEAGARLETSGAAFKLAVVGAAGVVVITCWELLLIKSPPDNSARLAIYWVDERWRWPLLFAAGTVGLTGLVRLARRGHIVPAFWFGGCFALGVAGALGLPLPVWYRFLLLCQIPLALGVAVVLAEAGRSRTAAIISVTFAFAISVKVLTLVAAPPTISYFGTPLQAAWSLGKHVPPGPGLVATDPQTAYFIPAATGHRVLTVDKGHVSSQRELALSAEGYRLLRRYYGGGPDWWAAGQEMWRRGVRYVVIEKHTTLEPERLGDFIWQTARLRTQVQRRALGNYFYENNRVGKLLYDSPDYVVYRLDYRKLFPSASEGPTS